MTEIHLDTVWQRNRGVIGRYPKPGEEYVFHFGSVKPRRIHMIGVRRPLEVEWYVDAEKVASETLDPWFGTAKHRCNRVVERRPE